MGKILRRLSIQLLAIAAGGFLFWGCGDAGCLENRTSTPLILFYNRDNPSQQFSLDSVSVKGIGQPLDSLLLDTARQVSQLRLPLRDDVDSTAYVIRYDWANAPLPDTLVFYYQSYPYFASMDCGCMFNYTLDSVTFTYHLFDSVAVVKPLIDNQNVENIQFFYPVPQTVR